MRTLLFVAPWEASRAVARVPARPSARVTVCFVESLAMGARLPWHRQKLVLVLSAMRHFADALRADGHRVDYRRAADYAEGVLDAAREHGAERVVATRARDWYQGGEWARLRATLRALPRPPRLELREDHAFLVTPEAFARWAALRRAAPQPASPTVTLEPFYRAVRRRYGVLLDARGRPEGGRWNFDHENRRPWPRGRPAPAAYAEPPDALTRRVMARVARWDWCWGPAEGFALPVTRGGALAWLERFVAERLPEFGPYEDAMVDGAPDLLHSTLAPLLNVGLLHPLEVVRRAERAYRDGAAPLASAEGFVRQVLGWREYMRGRYWQAGPALERSNALGATRPLPRVFWAPDGEAYGAGAPPAPDPRPPDPSLRMRCVTDAVRHVRDRARVHHIPRLMVQANFATLLGVRPQDLNRWFWAGFADGAHWVTTPNVVGMATWGDGGGTASKPYVASGAYVARMGDQCRRCDYDPGRRTGPGACPLNALYWDFLARHRARFADHPRMRPLVQNLGRVPPAELAEMRARAAEFRDAVQYDAPYEPEPVAADALVTTWNAPAIVRRAAAAAEGSAAREGPQAYGAATAVGTSRAELRTMPGAHPLVPIPRAPVPLLPQQ